MFEKILDCRAKGAAREGELPIELIFDLKVLFLFKFVVTRFKSAAI